MITETVQGQISVSESVEQVREALRALILARQACASAQSAFQSAQRQQASCSDELLAAQNRLSEAVSGDLNRELNELWLRT